MFEIGRIVRNIETKSATDRNLSAMTTINVADFGTTCEQVQETAAQRADILERLTRMSTVYGADTALKTVGRYDFFEMARKCNHCPHERKY